MERIYKVLDYQNKRIYGDCTSPVAVCIVLDVVSKHSNSYEVVTTNGEFVMADFVFNEDSGKWVHAPIKKDTPRHLFLLEKALFLVKDAKRITKGADTSNSTADDFINECEAYLKSFEVRNEA